LPSDAQVAGLQTHVLFTQLPYWQLPQKRSTPQLSTLSPHWTPLQTSVQHLFTELLMTPSHCWPLGHWPQLIDCCVQSSYHQLHAYPVGQVVCGVQQVLPRQIWLPVQPPPVLQLRMLPHPSSTWPHVAPSWAHVFGVHTHWPGSPMHSPYWQ
jgi:hypothetical protein